MRALAGIRAAPPAGRGRTMCSTSTWCASPTAPRRRRRCEQGIGTGIHYPVPVHLQPAYRGRVALGPAGCRASERAAREVLSLPMYPGTHRRRGFAHLRGDRRAVGKEGQGQRGCELIARTARRADKRSAIRHLLAARGVADCASRLGKNCLFPLRREAGVAAECAVVAEHTTTGSRPFVAPTVKSVQDPPKRRQQRC